MTARDPKPSPQISPSPEGVRPLYFVSRTEMKTRAWVSCFDRGK